MIRLKSQLWWYDGRGWDHHPERVCLILDADDSTAFIAVAAAAMAEEGGGGRRAAAALLLIDESPTWVWIDKQSAENITKK